MNQNNKQDDGSLAFLNIQLEGKNKQFNCKQTNQTELANTSFWILDYIPNIEVKNRDKEETKKYLIKIKKDINDPETEALKFFTGSESVKMIVDKIAEMDAFPRKVTLKKAGLGFTLM